MGRRIIIKPIPHRKKKFRTDLICNGKRVRFKLIRRRNQSILQVRTIKHKT